VGGDAAERVDGVMTLHFAYGANMSRTVMRRYAPGAAPLGAAALEGYRFAISGDGYATVEPASGHSVHGVLWRIAPRDRVSLDAWENIAAGLYRAEFLPIVQVGRHVRALVRSGRGIVRPRPGRRHRHRQAEIDQAGDAVARSRHAAGHDAGRNATGPARR
jgi:gamma-glutamylcyclotransferase (GGCT)/AIG2-like uncharacterized protein YtfP